jgi:hypothetical protein
MPPFPPRGQAFPPPGSGIAGGIGPPTLVHGKDPIPNPPERIAPCHRNRRRDHRPHDRRPVRGEPQRIMISRQGNLTAKKELAKAIAGID